VELGITCGARDEAFCQAVAFQTPEGHAVVVMTNDEVTVGPIAAGGTSFCISSVCVPSLGQLIVPPLAKGQGSFTTIRRKSLTWTITCVGQSISGELPWRGIQTVVMPCNGNRRAAS